MTPSTSVSDRPVLRMLRLLHTALVVVVALALLLVVALAVASFLGWPRGDAPDLYAQVNASEPSAPSSKAAWESTR